MDIRCGTCVRDYGGVVTALETVREIDRRVLLVHVNVAVGLITRVLGRVSHSARHPTPASGGARVISPATQRGQKSERFEKQGKLVKTGLEEHERTGRSTTTCQVRWK